MSVDTVSDTLFATRWDWEVAGISNAPTAEGSVASPTTNDPAATAVLNTPRRRTH
jgi:hypothetical protein